MTRQPAKVLDAVDVRRLLQALATTRHPVRNHVLVLLSFHAGLRACEISGLTWTMVLGPSGHLADTLSISGGIAKGGRPRCVPVSTDLRAALQRLHREQKKPREGPVIRSERGRAMTARSVVNWFRAIYDSLGLQGCSSHSGRRTFITRAARLLSKTGGSLRDVQELAGHSSLTTTERYIQGDRVLQHKLINLL